MSRPPSCPLSRIVLGNGPISVGIAMGTGTDAAIEIAGITLVKGDLAGIARAAGRDRAKFVIGIRTS